MKHVLIAILGTLICGNSFANTFDHPTIHYWCAEIWESSRSEGISVSQGENGFNKSEVLNYGEAVGLGTNNFEAASLSFSSKPSASFEGGSPVYYLTLARGSKAEARVLSYEKESGKFRTHYYYPVSSEPGLVKTLKVGELEKGQVSCEFRTESFDVEIDLIKNNYKVLE